MVESAPNPLFLYWHTLRHLRLVQWRYRVKNTVQSCYYRLFPAHVRRELLRRVPREILRRSADAGGMAWFQKSHDGSHGMFQTEEILKGRFTFLNSSKQFDGPVRWKNPEFSYLWDFNLHYFEYLEPLSHREDNSSPEVIALPLDGWIDANPSPVRPAWHPYPTSLRTINWIKLLVNHPEFAEEKILRSLYSQFLFLEKNLEGHLQANHLLENGHALVFGGLFFQGKDANRWLEVGLRLLKHEVEVEYLPRGGHYERSPMYHCILLEGLLDTYAYLTSMKQDAAWLSAPLRKMCEWLEKNPVPRWLVSAL